jgi:hypothetical protein
MEKKAQVSFNVQPFEGTLSITPVVDGTPLSEMVAAFEREQHFEPAGGFGGLIPEWFKYGALEKYFLGDFEHVGYFARMNRVYLLGCQCGEVGCWPVDSASEPRVNLLCGTPSDNRTGRTATTQGLVRSSSMQSNTEKPSRFFLRLHANG